MSNETSQSAGASAGDLVTALAKALLAFVETYRREREEARKTVADKAAGDLAAVEGRAVTGS